MEHNRKVESCPSIQGADFACCSLGRRKFSEEFASLQTYRLSYSRWRSFAIEPRGCESHPGDSATNRRRDDDQIRRTSASGLSWCLRTSHDKRKNANEKYKITPANITLNKSRQVFKPACFYLILYKY